MTDRDRLDIHAQIDRQTDRRTWTDRQTDRKTCTYRQTDIERRICTDWQTKTD